MKLKLVIALALIGNAHIQACEFVAGGLVITGISLSAVPVLLKVEEVIDNAIHAVGQAERMNTYIYNAKKRDEKMAYFYEGEMEDYRKLDDKKRLMRISRLLAVPGILMLISGLTLLYSC